MSPVTIAGNYALIWFTIAVLGIPGAAIARFVRSEDAKKAGQCFATVAVGLLVSLLAFQQLHIEADPIDHRLLLGAWIGAMGLAITVVWTLAAASFFVVRSLVFKRQPFLPNNGRLIAFFATVWATGLLQLGLGVFIAYFTIFND